MAVGNIFRVKMLFWTLLILVLAFFVVDTAGAGGLVGAFDTYESIARAFSAGAT